jgi:TP901 family phage tail tape measure protein
MTSKIVGNMKVMLGLDDAKFKHGLNAQQAQIRNFGAVVAKVGAGLSIASTGIALAVKQQLNYADSIGKWSQRSGIAAEELSVFQHAAALSDVSTEKLSVGIKTLSRMMDEAARGGKRAAETFAEIGVAVTDAEGGLRKTEDIMKDVAEVFKDMPDGAEKTALAMKLFGESGVDMITMLNGGRDALSGMLQEARDLGLEIDSNTAEAAAKFNDNLTRLRATVTGIAIQVMSSLAPALVRISDAAVEASKVFRNLSPGVQQVISTLAGLTVVTGPLLLGLGLTAMAIGPIAAGFAALTGPIGLTIIGLTAVGAAAAYVYSNWEPIRGWFTTLWGEIAAQHKNAWSEVSDFADKHSPDWLKNFVNLSVEGAKAPLPIFEVAVKESLDLIKRYMIDPVGTIESTWAGMGEFFSGVMTEIKTNIQNIWEEVKASVRTWHEDFMQAGREIVNGLANGIRELIDKPVKAISDVGNRMLGKVKSLFQIQSPSRVFREIGGHIVDGLSLGIKAKAPDAEAALAGVGQALIGQGGSLASGMQQFRSSMESAFVGAVTGAMKFKDALRQVLSTLAQVFAKRAFNSLFGKLLGGIPGFAVGTSYAPGGLAMVGERGPELVDLPRGSRVFTASKTGEMLREAGGGQQGGGVLQVRLSDGLIAEVLKQAGSQSIQLVQAYDRALPDRVQAIKENPRKR